MRNRISIAGAVILLGITSQLRAAQVDLGITLGYILGSGASVISDARVELGTFAGYSDTTGVSAYFSGKDWTTLRGSFTSLLEISSPQALNASSGQYYGSFDTVSTAANTRLFAWIHSTTTPLASANWAVITGGANPTGENNLVFNPMWLAVAPSAGEINIIEAATIYTQVVASSGGASIIASSEFDPEGANISLVPEPSTGALMMIGAAGLVALRRLRKV